MKRSNGWKLTILLLVSGLFATAQDMNMEITGFRVPDYDDQGEMSSQLFGEKAEIQPNGEVKINGMRIEFYKEKETFMEVTSPYCFYNQKEQKAHSDAVIFADMERVQMCGKGFVLESEVGAVRVLDDTVVTIHDIMQQKDGEASDSPGAKGGVTVITSKEMLIDHNSRTVWFEKNVHVEDPKVAIDCDVLEVNFSENNEIDWIEALGAVKLVNEGRVALANKAVYDTITDEFLLEGGNPRIVDGRNVLLGERIRFWKGTGRMVCEPSARLVIYPDDELKNDLFGK